MKCHGVIVQAWKELNLSLRNDFCDKIKADDYLLRLSGKRIVEDSWNSIGNDSLKMKGEDFENYCMRFLSVNGFSKITGSKSSGDHGIDIIAEQLGVKYGIQCKCYSDKVGSSAVQEAFSGSKYNGCDVAIVMTNSDFTRQAKDEAEQLGVKLWGKDVID